MTKPLRLLHLKILNGKETLKKTRRFMMQIQEQSTKSTKTPIKISLFKMLPSSKTRMSRKRTQLLGCRVYKNKNSKK